MAEGGFFVSLFGDVEIEAIFFFDQGEADSVDGDAFSELVGIVLGEGRGGDDEPFPLAGGDFSDGLDNTGEHGLDWFDLVF